MLDPRKQNMFDPGIGGCLIPSGMHHGVPNGDIVRMTPLRLPDWGLLANSDKVKVSICNPMPASDFTITKVDEISAESSSIFLSERPKLKLISQCDLADYADLLSQVAKWLQIRGYHGVVIPLRGGMKPWNQLAIMTEHSLRECLLPFTQGANGVDRDQIRHYLSDFFQSFAGISPLRLAIVDTADNGDSAAALARLILSLRKDCRDDSKWLLDFILFFESKNGVKYCPPECVPIPKMGNHRLTFRVFACGTRSLITEDWDLALGIRTQWKDGKTPEIIILPSYGRVVVQNYSGMLVEYESDRLDQFTDILLGNEVSDAVVTDDSLLFHEDVFEKYQNVDEREPPSSSQGDEGVACK